MAGFFQNKPENVLKSILSSQTKGNNRISKIADFMQKWGDNRVYWA